jgi:hypothetical protein
VLCQSTRIALSPCHLEPRPQPRDPPNPPATEAGQDRKEEHLREKQQEGRVLIAEISERAHANAPTASATGEAAQPRLALHLDGDPELSPRKTGRGPGKTTYRSYPGTFPPPPPAGIAAGGARDRELSGASSYCSEEETGGGESSILLIHV